MKNLLRHSARSSRQRMTFKDFVEINQIQILGALISLPIFVVSGIALFLAPRLPLYVLESRLKDFEAFETRLDAVVLNFEGELRLNRFIVKRNDEVIVDQGESAWYRFSGTDSWDKRNQTYSAAGKIISTDEARKYSLLFEPTAIMTALKSRRLSMADVKTPETIVTEIRIPAAEIQDVIISNYIEGYKAINRREDKDRCFMGMVKGFTIDAISTAGSISGDLIFTIDHKEWDLVKIDEPLPDSVTVDFHGKLCTTGEPISGQHLFSLTSATTIVKSISPKLPQYDSGLVFIDLPATLWRLKQYR